MKYSSFYTLQIANDPSIGFQYIQKHIHTCVPQVASCCVILSIMNKVLGSNEESQ